MSKRKRPETGLDEVADDDDDEEEDAEMQRRLDRRRGEQSARMAELYDDFIRVATPEQLDRFEHWKRSKFPRSAMRRLMTDILGSSSERGSIVLATVAKMFVGDLVESAREHMNAVGESGPIQPGHLRQALRAAQRSGSASFVQTTRLFWR